MKVDDSQLDNIYTPSELNHEAKIHLEAGFGRICVQGEISNLSRPASGHLYFTLKDKKAQIRCALFRSNAYGMGFKPENGMLVRCFGRVSLYEARGDYQMIADKLKLAGEGLLRAKFEALKISLDAEGLFREDLKKPLPAYPTRIAVITSPSGAALRDILNVLKRRWPLAHIRVYGVPVQGDEAAPAIVKAIAAANEHAWADLILAGRGGGSLEDLWAFNEETVARAIFASDLPVVSAVGHEIDVSISDYVADLRAPTPSAAAELISPDQSVLINRISVSSGRLSQLIISTLQNLAQRVDNLSHRLNQQHPGQRLIQHQKWLNLTIQRLQLVAQRIIPERRRKLQALVQTLEAVSPLPTLSRGYAIVSDFDTGVAISSVSEVKPKQIIHTQLQDGRIKSTIDEVDDETIDANPA